MLIISRTPLQTFVVSDIVENVFVQSNASDSTRQKASKGPGSREAALEGDSILDGHKKWKSYVPMVCRSVQVLLDLRLSPENVSNRYDRTSDTRLRSPAEDSDGTAKKGEIHLR